MKYGNESGMTVGAFINRVTQLNAEYISDAASKMARATSGDARMNIAGRIVASNYLASVVYATAENLGRFVVDEELAERIRAMDKRKMTANWWRDAVEVAFADVDGLLVDKVYANSNETRYLFGVGLVEDE